MTPTAKKIFISLVLGNIGIFIIGFLLYQHFLDSSIGPKSMYPAIDQTNQVIQKIKTQPTENWEKIIGKKLPPTTQLSLSAEPKFDIPNTNRLEPKKIFQDLKKNHVTSRSVLLNDGNWLNVTYTLPRQRVFQTLLYWGFFTGIWLILLIILIYWAVKKLNTPVLTLLQGLKQAKEQNAWSPLPLIGEAEQKNIFADINEMQAKATQSLQDRTQMLAAISHDLRTPLTRIKLRTEYLDKNEHYEKLITDIADMEIMISETLDYFRDASFEESPQRFDIIALINSICADFSDLDFKVKFKKNDKKVIFNGRVNLLKRALNNLINNAIHYGKQALITLKQDDKALTITIDDAGKGMTEQEIQQAFKPFYRSETSRSRETGGSGLGLTIAKEIVQLHHGEIELLNHPGGGLRVKITLPV
jgi:signal transduction histidine kinase